MKEARSAQRVSIPRDGALFDHSEPAPDVSWHRTVDALDVLLRAWPTD